MSSKEKSILVLARVRDKAPGKDCAWFVISPDGVIEEILGHVPPVDVNFPDGGTMNFSWSTCALVGSVIYAAGPTDARRFPGLCSINTTTTTTVNGWDYKPVPSVSNSVIAALNDCLYLFPDEKVSPSPPYNRVGVALLIDSVPMSDFIYVYDTKLEKLKTIGFDKLFILKPSSKKVVLYAFSVYDGKQMLKKNLLRSPFDFVYNDCGDGLPYMVATADNRLLVMFTSGHLLPSTEKPLPVISFVKIELSEDHKAIKGFERINVPKTSFADHQVTTLIDCLPYDYEVKDTAHSYWPTGFHVTNVKPARKRKGLTSSHPKASPPTCAMDKNIYELLCSKCQDKFKQEPAEEEMEVDT